MGEHPVRVQPKMVMTSPPRSRYRIRLVGHERIKTSPAERPRGRQTSRPSTNDYDILIHDASLNSAPPAVNNAHPPRLSLPTP
jgi:hypothetical protein